MYSGGRGDVSFSTYLASLSGVLRLFAVCSVGLCFRSSHVMDQSWGEGKEEDGRRQINQSTSTDGK